ncbi:MAG: hypothetical protein GF399_08885 [Candidatus Coatesbacteria bacterium]|nr:hypothetical protein [Candidatus Coatesbacteria bacterium]
MVPRQHRVGRRNLHGILAGVLGGTAGLTLQFILLRLFDLGPRLTELHPGLIEGVGAGEIVVYVLFILAESAVAGFLYSVLHPLLPGRAWLKALIFGAALWVFVNLLPLLVREAVVDGGLLPAAACWSAAWLLFILVQTEVTAVFYRLLRSKRGGDGG